MANKSIHFNIITIFAVVFVCVYLYFTISDMKKIAVEVKKNSQDISSIVTTLGTLTKELAELKKKAAACSVGTCGTKIPNVVITPQTQTQAKVNVGKILEEDEDIEDDSDSINTNDVKQLLSDIPDDVVDDVVDEDKSDEHVVLDSKQVDVNNLVDYKSLTLEQLKEKCREKNLSVKGNKDTLIQRLESA